MTAANEHYATRAAFFLTLARAFAPPHEPAVAEAFRCDLALDLEEMGGELAYDLGDAPALLREAAAGIDEPEVLAFDHVRARSEWDEAAYERRKAEGAAVL